MRENRVKRILREGGLALGTHVGGIPDHRIKNTDIVDHLVGLIEKKAREVEAAREPVAAE